MGDPYSSDSECIKRLLEEYGQYRTLIIAYEFDNTVYDWSKKEFTFERTIAAIRNAYSLGFHLIVYTRSSESRMAEISEYLNSQRIPFHTINESHESSPYDGPKLFYNLLLDSRAGLSAALNILETVIAQIRSEKATSGLTEIA